MIYENIRRKICNYEIVRRIFALPAEAFTTSKALPLKSNYYSQLIYVNRQAY